MKQIYLILFLLFVLSLSAQTIDTISNSTTKVDSSQIKWQLAIEKEQQFEKQELDTILDNVYWAHEVVVYSSEYDDYNHAAMQILGKPNSMPIGGDSKVAW